MSKASQKDGFEDSLSLPANQRRTRLEEAFFLDEDQKLIDKLRALKRMKETREALTRISGIKNETILEKLIALDIRPETLASLMLVPLVEVAWADGKIDKEEKKAVLLASTEAGFAKGSTNYDLLKNWMHHRPSPQLLEAWTVYVKGLCELLKPEEIDTLRNELLKNAKDIAEASGGILGLGIGDRISPEERNVLTSLAKAFSKSG